MNPFNYILVNNGSTSKDHNHSNCILAQQDKFQDNSIYPANNEISFESETKYNNKITPGISTRTRMKIYKKGLENS